MYQAERRREIIKLMEGDSSVSVAQLSERFGVSRATIRRDLNELHASGFLQRTHGGAVPADGLAVPWPRSGDEPPFNERRTARAAEKERIGRAAAELVQPGETIFVDGGTTTEKMVAYLAGKSPLTVVTYGLNIINSLVAEDQITVILIGGTLHHRSLTLGGVLAIDNIQAYNLRFDRTFLAAGGFSAAAGATNAGLEEIPVKRRAVAAARETVLLADSSKLGVVATAQIVPATAIQRAITGVDAPEAEVAALRDLGLVVDLV